MAEFEVHGHVSMSFSALIEAESEEAAVKIAEADPVWFWSQGLEEGDTPNETDIEVEYAEEA